MRRNLACIAAFVAFLVMGGALGCSATGSTDFDEVRKLLLLEGEAYEDARNELLRSRPGKWDQQAANAEEGDLGLAVFILNARIADPESFEVFDSFILIDTVDGRPRLAYSEPQSSAAWHAFVIEYAWKDLWPEEACWDVIEGSLMHQDIGGSASMWEKYSTPSTKPFLRSVAIYALGKHPGFRERAAAVLAEDFDRDDRRYYFSDQYLARRSVIRSLQFYAPDFTVDLIVETLPRWQDDPAHDFDFVRLLVRESEDDPRPLLYQWLHDGRRGPDFRYCVFSTLGLDYQPRDVVEFRRLLEDGHLPEWFRDRVTRYLEDPSNIPIPSR